jgi:hypothetical protein
MKPIIEITKIPHFIEDIQNMHLTKRWSTDFTSLYDEFLAKYKEGYS